MLQILFISAKSKCLFFLCVNGFTFMSVGGAAATAPPASCWLDFNKFVATSPCYIQPPTHTPFGTDVQLTAATCTRGESTTAAGVAAARVAGAFQSWKSLKRKAIVNLARLSYTAYQTWTDGTPSGVSAVRKSMASRWWKLISEDNYECWQRRVVWLYFWKKKNKWIWFLSNLDFIKYDLHYQFGIYFFLNMMKYTIKEIFQLLNVT